MSLSAPEEVAAHWREVNEADRETYEADFERLKKDTEKWPKVHGHLNQPADLFKTRVVSKRTPRAPHKVMHEAFYRAAQEDDYSAASRFVCERLVPYCGLTQDISAKAELAPSSRNSTNSCFKAEDYFADCIKQLKDPNTNYFQRTQSVFHDQEGRPIILQKRLEEATGLLLEPVSVDGGIIPAGMIVGVERSYFKDKERLSDTLYAKYSTSEVDKLAIMPLRLSPWAYDEPLDRAIFALDDADTNRPRCNSERQKIVEGYTIGDFRQAAQDILAMCGVNQPAIV